MFTVGLDSVNITLSNAMTLIAQLVLGPSVSVSEIRICEAKLTVVQVVVRSPTISYPGF
jgi:hypothetical protein